MSLIVKLKDIGIIKQAEFSLGDLTIICGENNTGKTYISYALYGFLHSWNNFFQFPISDDQVNSLIATGSLEIETQRTAEQILKETCSKYSKHLSNIFAANEESFLNSEFHLFSNNFGSQSRLPGFRRSFQGHFISASLRRRGDGKLSFTACIDKKPGRQADQELVRDAIKFRIAEVIFFGILPKTYIFASERTGTTIFRKELDYVRSRLLDEMGQAGSNKDTPQLFSKVYHRYPAPINENIDYSRQLDAIAKSKSFISKEHPEVLEDLIDIVGGEYVITQNDQLYFIPKGTKTQLTMVESSSAVRSLLDLGFYLRHIAEKGDLLMIDEPELSLHPENQRRIARLFARLVNIGVKIFITTHSDYIIKELNTLIMLNHDKPHLKAIAEENGYQQSELIKADQVKVYVAEKALLPLEDGQKRRKRAHTLVPAKIHPKFGIEVPSFDKTIDEMNRIQDEIVWGEE